MTVEELYKDFCENFQCLSALTAASSTPEWTKAVYNCFHAWGRKNNFKVYSKPNILGTGEQEYLVDLCWSKEDGQKYSDYKGLELALESEWLTSEDEIMWDFCKLIDVKAFIKTMVICIKEEEINRIINLMAETVKSSRIKFDQENYLIIAFIPLPTITYPTQYVIRGSKISSEGYVHDFPSVDFIFKAKAAL